MLSLSDPIRVMAQETGGTEAPLLFPNCIIRAHSNTTTAVIEEIIEDLPRPLSPQVIEDIPRPLSPQVYTASAVSSTQRHSPRSKNSQQKVPSPRGAPTSAFAVPEEKKKKKEKKEQSTGRRWFRFRAGFSNKASVAKENTPDDEVTMVSAFTDNDDSDSVEEVNATTPYSHRSKEEHHAGQNRSIHERLERIDSDRLPGRAQPVVSKAWF
jgi:hypothetical protein